jgi:predicted exporter
VSQQQLFAVVGFIIGIGGTMMVAQSFIAERGARKVLPVAIPLAICCGIGLAWALVAWINFFNASATMGS